MKLDNEKVLRKQREKKSAMAIAARRRQKETTRRMEEMAFEVIGGNESRNKYEKNCRGDRI